MIKSQIRILIIPLPQLVVTCLSGFSYPIWVVPSVLSPIFSSWLLQQIFRKKATSLLFSGSDGSILAGRSLLVWSPILEIRVSSSSPGFAPTPNEGFEGGSMVDFKLVGTGSSLVVSWFGKFLFFGILMSARPSSAGSRFETAHDTEAPGD